MSDRAGGGETAPLSTRSISARFAAAREVPSRDSAPPSLRSASRPRKKKILLVDDSLTVLMMHRLILNRGSYDILTARDGREAVDIAFRERPDLIIMDVVMPRMDGLEACRQIRSSLLMKAVPIILVTARSELGNVAHGFASGAAAYLTKPVDNVELLAKIKLCIGE